MAQLSLYLEESEMEQLRYDAQREGLSLSRYAARLIRENAGNTRWPKDYWESVYGCLTDDSFEISSVGLDSNKDDSADWFE